MRQTLDLRVSPVDDPRPLLRRLLRGWLVGGLLLVACVPDARGHSLLIGWLPYWLLLAPLLSLLLLDRQRLLDEAGQRLRRRRNPRRAGRQARRRLPMGRALRLAALLGGGSRTGV